MPYKALFYYLKYIATGLSLSSIAILGFTYFLMLPGEDGSFLERLVLVNQQVMLISHLIMPLVVLIGLAYGLGLLHNHSEIVQLMQLQATRSTLAVIIAIFAVLTVTSEVFVWPEFEAPITLDSQTNWIKKDQRYFQSNEEIRTENNKIIAYRNSQFNIGDIPANELGNNITHADTKTFRAISLLKAEQSQKNAYAQWQFIHQAIWPLFLFWFLWKKLNKIQRGTNAAAIAGSVAFYAISLGLIAEATHIILAKALVDPIITGLIPSAINIAILSYRVKHS